MRAFCAEHGVQVRLFWEMPRGHEEDANAYAYAQVCVLCGEMDALRRLVFGTVRRFSSISTSFVRDFCESLHGTPLDFRHLKQYTAKVIQNVRRTERSTAMMLSGSYYYFATARFYAGRYFAVPVFPSHEA